MKTNAMKRAHEIKREAAKKYNCKESHIIFSLCLKMAWAEIKRGKKMVQLTGTEKQIAWAEKIRTDLLNWLNGMSLEEIESSLYDGCKNEYTTDEVKANIEKIKNVDSAVWWINQKECTGKDVALLVHRVTVKREYR